MWFLQMIDNFVGDLFKEDTDLLQKARLLVGAILVFIMSVVGFSPMYAFIPNLEGAAIYAYFFIGMPVLAFWVYLLKLLKNGQRYNFTAHSVVASTAVVLFAGICVTGGPLFTEVHPLLMIGSIFSFILIGKRGGIIWTGIIACVYFLLVAMNYADVEFVNLPPEESRTMLRVFNWSYAFFLVAALAMIYESINIRVMRERDVEREKFKHIARVAVDTSIVTKSADSLADSGERLLAAAIQQKTAIEQLATTTEELGATAEQNTVMAASAKTSIKDTEDHLKVSKADLLQLVSSMNQMRTSSEEIQTINNVINDISYQTNILSLNAMIEASRSSESSGGFKVVALEVKRLAERSAKAADNINKLLDANFLSVQQGVTLSETMQLRFEEITAKIQPLALSIQNVSDASCEQSEAIRQITLGLNDIDKAIEENQRLAQTSSVTAKELRINAVGLMGVVTDMGIDL
jgi:hypothetical protein